MNNPTVFAVFNFFTSLKDPCLASGSEFFDRSHCLDTNSERLKNLLVFSKSDELHATVPMSRWQTRGIPVFFRQAHTPVCLSCLGGSLSQTKSQLIPGPGLYTARRLGGDRGGWGENGVEGDEEEEKGEEGEEENGEGEKGREYEGGMGKRGWGEEVGKREGRRRRCKVREGKWEGEGEKGERKRG